MSHFSVLVIGDDIEHQLAPFHEFECTGDDNEFVQSIDKTTELRATYEQRDTTVLRDPYGKLHQPYGDEFYRDPTPEESKKIGPFAGTGCGGGMSWSSRDWQDGYGYRTKIHFVPDGWEEVQVKQSTTESFIEFIEGWGGQKVVPFGSEPDLVDEHKYGYVLLDKRGEVLKVINRTNPNKKWDWYQVGGRMAGFFKLREGVYMDSVNRGTPSLLMDKFEYKEGQADSARKGDIDFAAMRDEQGQEAAEHYDGAMKIIGHLPTNEVFKAIVERLPEDEQGDIARDLYWKQPRCLAWKAAEKQAAERREDWPFGWDASPDDFLLTREQYIQCARNRAGVTFAVVRDGKWFERGVMGWWAIVSGEKDEETWFSIFANLVDGLPDDTRLTVVDCHI